MGHGPSGARRPGYRAPSPGVPGDGPPGGAVARTGKTVRHRLNRGGDRQANAALYRIVLVRLRWHQPTRDDVARRTAEGKTGKEIIRCLKRYVAREVFALLRGLRGEQSQQPAAA